MTQAAPPLISTYQRTVRASLDRIWENVLDWEHLPWLHRTSFVGIEPLDSSANGWKAWVTVRGRGEPSRSFIEVCLDRPGRRYVARTVEGAGTGGEIVTFLEPRGDRFTQITVEFRAPGVDLARKDELGAGYVRLYTRLWNEDEAMMVRRQALLDAARENRHTGIFAKSPVPLGSPAELRSQLPMLVKAHGELVRVVEIDGQFLAHSTVCPHRGGPLDAAPVRDGCITCPWHGYRYDVRTGASADGHGLRIDPAPAVLVDRLKSEVFLVWPAVPGAGGV